VLADGVTEGRRIFANTLKYVLMGTSSNFGNIFSAAGASLFLSFLPMLPSKIPARRAAAPTHQGELLPVWRHHAIFTDSPLAMLAAWTDLWVPETRRTSGDLLIFMEEPAEAVASFDLGGLACCTTGERTRQGCLTEDAVR
jgi:hypothetical protein